MNNSHVILNDQSQTPFADALLRLTSSLVGSVHALPLSQGHILEESALREKYLTLFGSQFLAADVSFSSPVIDSFFRPRTCLAEAQRLAAAAFGSDRTLFLTCGTTSSNSVALKAMRLAGRRVLVDRTAHQSVHFALDHSATDVTYSGFHGVASGGVMQADVDVLVKDFVKAANAGHPYDALVLSGSSYDGALLRLPALLNALFDAVDELDILVDEAWTALSSFYPSLAAQTALAAGQHIRKNRPDKRFRLYVTHSAHKSMAALRQGSYLQILADPESIDIAIEQAERALYTVHTTSPSLPILASLDLARAHAAVAGEAVVERCLRHAQRLRDVLGGVELPGLTNGRPQTVSDWSMSDPTKVVCDTTGLGISAQDLRMKLFNDDGIYVARGAGNRLLLNIHAGVTDSVLERLERALRSVCMQRATGQAEIAPVGGGEVDLEAGFLVPYPPGIPLTVPGEDHPENLSELIAEFQRSGVEVFSVPGRPIR